MMQATKKSEVCKHKWGEEGLKAINSCGGWANNFLLMAEIQNKIMNFRDILDLPPYNRNSSMNELLIGAVNDFQKLYPKFVSTGPISATNSTSIYQGLQHFYEAMKFVEDSWAETHMWSNKFIYKKDGDIEDISLEQLGERVLERLDYMSKVSKEIFDPNDVKDLQNKNTSDRKSRDFSKDSNLDGKGSFCRSPLTPTSVLPETIQFPHAAYSPPLLLPLRLQAVGKLKPIDVKRLSFHMFPHNSNEEDQKEQSNNKELPLEVAVASEMLDIKTKEESVYGKLINETPKNQKVNSHDATNNGGSVESDLSNMLPKPTALPSPPPPILFTKGTALPSPPPPILLTKGTALPSPPPPPPFIQNVSAMPSPPPPMMPPKGFGSLAPPPMPISKGSAPPPPPPPLGVTKALRPKKAHPKLKRSTKMGHLYRLLKGKVEGSSLDGKSSHGRKNHVGGCSGNKAQGMADALAEITKRSAYFKKIEEDVQKHATTILEMKSAIDSFQTKDMSELLKFHQYVELHLEGLTDETQVLARFEYFPAKKLETIRMAAALFSKLEAITNNLQSWNIVAPLSRQLDKIECYFNKIKVEVDTMERTKEEESKRFQSHKIN